MPQPGDQQQPPGPPLGGSCDTNQDGVVDEAERQQCVQGGGSPPGPPGGLPDPVTWLASNVAADLNGDG
ncbi:MAG: hypothetical protein AB1505_04425, partial [Candidatus Latescibacterota bacterium]